MALVWAIANGAFVFINAFFVTVWLVRPDLYPSGPPYINMLGGTTATLMALWMYGIWKRERNTR